VAEQPAQTSFDLERFASVAWRRLPWLAAPVVVLMPLVLAAVAALPPEYQASSTLLIREPEIPNPFGSQRTARVRPQQHRVNMQQKMLSTENLRSTVTALGLDREVLWDTPVEAVVARVKERIPPLRPAPMNEAKLRERLIHRLRRRIILHLQGDQSIEVIYRGINSSLNARIVNTLVSGFIEDSLRSRANVSQVSVEFLEKTLETYRRNLEESERKLKEFQEQHFIDAPPDVSANAGALARDRQQLVETEIHLRQLQSQLEFVNQQISMQEENITSQRTTETNPRAARLEAEIAGMEIRLSEMLGTLTEDHPRVFALQETIDQLKADLAQEQGEIVTSEVTAANPVFQQLVARRSEIETQIEGEQTRRQLYEERVQATEKRILNVPAEQIELNKLEAERQLNQELYDRLNLQLASADIDALLVKEQEHTETYKIVETAEASTIPVGPDRLRLTLAGVVMCLALGIAATVGIEFMDETFRDATSAQDVLGLPLLATIPPIMTRSEIRYRQLKRAVLLSVLTVALVIEAIATLVVSGML